MAYMKHGLGFLHKSAPEALWCHKPAARTIGCFLEYEQPPYERESTYPGCARVLSMC